MFKATKIFALSIFIISLFFCWQSIAYAGVGQAGADNPDEYTDHFDPNTGLRTGQLIIPELKVTIPGVIFGSDKGNWLGEYIAGVYKYATAIVGILAAIVLMFGGLLWLTAGGESGRVTEAKEWIKASLTGLILALSSYTILYTINPELVQFKSLNIKNTGKKTPIKSSMFEQKTDFINPTTGQKVIIRGNPELNRVYVGTGTPLAGDASMINPLDDKRIRDIIGSGAQDTANIEKQMADALATLETYINTGYNNQAAAENRRQDIIRLNINSLSDGDHDLAGRGDSTHSHGRAADITGIDAIQAGVVGEWWINQGQGRRFIWEGDHLHIDIGYPSGG
ncbi:hypothetical protein COT99_03925 [Candidatus Falkowbacteria bacterium CG10_big_fil_rev_8_21_14_0_10_43_10]|uniref:Peptidase M15A C-terminal domain-containing protein n=1 Tax=Candidatus Falkowbacteria bacterium CG10_big_fil_rev_8_21_14_0_10_43_10 TaxID=1974567 RepID=A0A2H0V186_9BACT|nr:MAG: hypothetical protein COT99_03925 [Candidatus Falkowbacteria bacterium CG10_big_fil_rev_8_21_14_0_10_43_10]